MSHLRFVTALSIFLLLGVISVAAQDMSVAGLRLGDREAGRAFLSDYLPRMTDGGPAYFFYNKNADTVMRATAASLDDRFFITGIEVYAVDQTYRSRHFQLENIARFTTESGVFIGWHQSGKGIAATLIIGVPYPLGVNSTGKNEIAKRYGEPTRRSKTGNIETLDYQIAEAKLSGENAGKYGYAARFEFNKHDLERFSIQLVPKVTP